MKKWDGWVSLMRWEFDEHLYTSAADVITCLSWEPRIWQLDSPRFSREASQKQSPSTDNS